MTAAETPAEKLAYSDVRDLLDTAARYSKEKAEKRAVGDMEGVVACSEAEKLALRTAYDLCVEKDLSLAWCPGYLVKEFQGR